jgi:predicted DNA-binding protein
MKPRPARRTVTFRLSAEGRAQLDTIAMRASLDRGYEVKLCEIIEEIISGHYHYVVGAPLAVGGVMGDCDGPSED